MTMQKNLDRSKMRKSKSFQMLIFLIRKSRQLLEIQINLNGGQVFLNLQLWLQETIFISIFVQSQQKKEDYSQIFSHELKNKSLSFEYVMEMTKKFILRCYVKTMKFKKELILSPCSFNDERFRHSTIIQKKNYTLSFGTIL